MTARGSSESRAVAIAVVSTLVVLAAIVVVVTQSPGLGRVQGVLPQLGVLQRLLRGDRARVPRQREDLPHRRGDRPRDGAADGDPPQPPRPGVLPDPRARGRLRRLLPRACPTILVILMLGQGIPALQLSWLPTDQIFWASVALVLVYTAYVSEVYRAGIESVHPSQEAAARSLGLTRTQSLRHVVVPQAVRRVIPPLLNDFIGLQKDTALVSVLGIVEVLRQTQIDQAATFNGTYYLVAATLFVLDHDPARAVHGLARRARPAPAAGGEARVSADSRTRARGHPQVVRQARGAARDRPDARRARGRLPDRRVRLGQVDAPPLRQPPRADRRGPHRGRRRARSPRAASTSTGPPRDRDRLPVVQPLPAHDASSRTSRSRRGRRAASRAARRDAPRRTRCSSGSASSTSATSTPTGSPAASSSASRSCGRSRCSRDSSCSTR